MSESISRSNEALTKFLARFHTNSLQQKMNLKKVHETLVNLNKISDMKNSNYFLDNDQSKSKKLILTNFLSQILKK